MLFGHLLTLNFQHFKLKMKVNDDFLGRNCLCTECFYCLNFALVDELPNYILFAKATF